MQTLIRHRSRLISRIALASVFSAVLSAVSPASFATTGTWIDTTSGGLWSAGGNWSSGIVADGADGIADFSTLNITTDNTVRLDTANRVIGGILFGDTPPSNNWTLDNNGNSTNVLTLAASAGTSPTITVNNQTATISASLAGTQGLTLAGPGTLVLSGNDTYTGATVINSGTLRLDGNSGSLNSTSDLTFGGAGVFNYQGRSTGSAQSFGKLNVNSGDAAVQSTYGTSGNTSLTFNNYFRSAGATALFVDSGGTIGGASPTNKIAFGPSTPTNSFIDQGTFFSTVAGASYAWYDSNGYVRAINYSLPADNNAVGVTTSTSSLPAGLQYIQISGAGVVTNQGSGAITTLNLANGSNFTQSTNSSLTLNGILKSGNSTGGTISGGILETNSGTELVIRTDQSNDTLTINSAIQGIGTTPITKSGAGKLTLGGSNSFSGIVTIDAGTLQLGSSNALSFNPVAFGGGSTGTLSLSGNSVTINGLSTSSAAPGAAIVQNASAASATLTVNNPAADTFAGTLQDGSGGALSLTNNTGALTLIGASTYTGATSVVGGRLILGPTGSLGNTSISVTGSANFSAQPGGGSNSAGGSLTLNAGTLFDMNDGAIGTFRLTASGTPLTIIGAGPPPGIAPTLSFEIGNGVLGTDKIAVTGNVSVQSGGGQIGISTVPGVSSIAIGNYNLITAAGGFSGNGGNGFSLTTSSISLGTGRTYNLSLANSTTTAEILTVTAGTPTSAYWNGSASNTWNTLNTGGVTNWRFDAASSSDTQQIPGSISNVFFTVNSGASNLSNTLGADFSINSLTFTGSGTSAATGSVTIGGANTLTISPNSSSLGIAVQIGSAAHSIASNIALGASQTWTNNSANPLTIGGVISGGAANSLTTAGSGSIALSGVNTFAGNTTIAGGTLVLGGNAPGGGPGTLGNSNSAVLLGAGSGSTAAALLTGGPFAVGRNIVVQSGSSGTLTIGGGQTNGGSTYSGGITLNQNATLTALAGGSVSFTGTISGSGGISLPGSGTVVLNAANTYLGGTTVNGGALSLTHFGNDDNLSTIGTGVLTINNGGTVSVDNTNALGLGLAHQTPITINAGGTMTISIGATAHLNTLTLAGGTLADPALNGSGNNFNHTFGYFNFDNNVTAGGTTATSTISAGDVALTTAGGTTFTVNSGAASGIDLDVTGAITAPAGVTNTGLIKSGPGVMRLSNANNSFTAGVTINAGTLLLGSSGALNSTTPNLVVFGTNNLGILTLNGNSVAVAGLSTNATLPVVQNASVTPVTLTISAASGSNIYAGHLQNGTGGGALSLIKTGAGSQTLSGLNTFTGGTTITGGTVRVANTAGSATGTDAVVVNGGGTLAGSTAVGQGFITGPVTLNGGGSLAASSGATLTLNGGLTLQAGSASTFTLGAPNGNANPLINVAGGNLVAGGPHTVNLIGIPQAGTYDLFAYIGTAPNFNNFLLGSASVGGRYTLVNNPAGSQIDLQFAPYTWTGQTNGVGLANSIWDTAQNNWASGINPVAVPNGSAVSFTDINAATGGPVTNPNVSIAAAGVLPAAIAFNNLALAYTVTNVGGTAGIGGSTGVTVSGGGTVYFLNSNSYSGPTVIAAGRLQVGNSAAGGSLNPATPLSFGGAPGGGGTFIYAPTGAGGTQSLAGLTFNSGDDIVESVNNGATVALGFSSLVPRNAGAVAQFISLGGVNGNTNSITLAAVPAGFIDQGTFFSAGVGSDFAWMNSTGGYVRNINYGGDANSEAITASVNTFNVSSGGHLYERISGSGAVTQQTTVSISSLNIANSNNLTFKPGNTLTVNGILKSGNAAGGSIGGGTGIQAANNAEMVVRTDGANDSLTIATSILANGTNALTKSGPGTLTLSGATANTYTGMTTVNDGTLNLAKNVNIVAVEGNLTVGDSNGAAGSAVVNLSNSGQFDNFNRPNVIIYRDGLLNLNNSSDTLANITMTGGTITTGSQRFYNSGDIATLPSAGSATIAGAFYLYGFSGQTHTWTVASGAAGVDLDVSAAVDGVLYNAPLVKAGPGILRLSGNNNLKSLALNTGTLLIGNDNALGSTATMIAGGGTLQADNPGHTLSNPITLASSLTVAGSPELFLSGVISGAGGLIKNGPGSLTLSGIAANTYSGVTTVNDGILVLSKPNTLAAVGTSLIIGDGLGQPGSANLTIGGGPFQLFAGNTNVSIKSDGILMFANSYDVIPALTMTGGTVTTAGAASYVFIGGNVTTLASSSTASLLSPVVPFIFSNGGDLQVTFNVAQGTAPSGIDLDVPAQIVNYQNFASSLVKTGPGTMRMSGDNSIANAIRGGVTVTAGTLAIGNDNALGTSTLFLNGGTIQADSAPHTIANSANLMQDSSIGGSHDLTLSGPVTLTGSHALTVSNTAATTLAGPIALGSNTLTIAGAGNATLSGIISGSGGLTKTGSGTLTITGDPANTYSGVTTVNDGTLVLAKSNIVFGAAVEAISGVVNIGDGIGASGSAIVTYNTNNYFQIANPTNITIKSDGVYDLGLNSAEYLGALVLIGGAVAESGNSYVGLKTSTMTQASDTTATISGSGASRVYLDDNSHTNTFTVALGTTANGIDLDIPAIIAEPNAFPETLAKAGPGVLRLSAANTFSGGVALNAGTLLIANDNALGSGTLVGNGGTIQADSGPRTITNPVTIASTLSVAGSQNLTLTGSMAGAGSLVKNGSGTLTLTGADSFAGPIIVNAGTLVQSGGALAADVINQSVFNYNSGPFNGRLINYGALVLNADFTAGGGLENDSNLTLGMGPPRIVSLGGSGLDNEGTLTLNTILFKLSSAATNVNRGNLNVVTTLAFNGAGTLTNSGEIALTGGFISGAGGSLVNAGGTVSGIGTIQSGFSNPGGLLAVGAGALNVIQPFTNAGNIQLTAFNSTLTGGQITNNGTIGGLGNIVNSVINTGTVAPSGGLLSIGSLSNRAGGLIRIAAGNQLLLTGGMAPISTSVGENAGVISLTGGTFDNNGHALNNTGQISGYGTFATGGAGLDNNGSITFTGGVTTINGNVANENGRTITVAQSPAIFTGLVTNNGGATFSVINTTATFAGGFVNNGSSNFVKAGNGKVEITTAPALADGSTLAVNAGTMKFNILSGTPSIGAGVSAIVSSGATLELAGPVAALSSGPHRVDIVNNSTAPGLLVSGQNQQVGNIDGSGITQVNAGSDLSADRIIQSALVIGGTSKNFGLVTITASDADGSPLTDLTSLANAAAPLAPSGSTTAVLAFSPAEIASNPGDLAIPQAAATSIASLAVVPEPSSIVLLAVAIAASLLSRRCGPARRGANRRTQVDWL